MTMINSDKVAKILHEQRKAWLGISPAANEAIADIERAMCQLLPEADRQAFIDAARVMR